MLDLAALFCQLGRKRKSQRRKLCRFLHQNARRPTLKSYTTAWDATDCGKTLQANAILFGAGASLGGPHPSVIAARRASSKASMVLSGQRAGKCHVVQARSCGQTHAGIGLMLTHRPPHRLIQRFKQVLKRRTFAQRDHDLSGITRPNLESCRR